MASKNSGGSGFKSGNGGQRFHEGRLGKCQHCGDTVYWCHRIGGRWWPIESWVAGNCEEGEIIPHKCNGNVDH